MGAEYHVCYQCGKITTATFSNFTDKGKYCSHKCAEIGVHEKLKEIMESGETDNDKILDKFADKNATNQQVAPIIEQLQERKFYAEEESKKESSKEEKGQDK